MGGLCAASVIPANAGNPGLFEATKSTGAMPALAQACLHPGRGGYRAIVMDERKLFITFIWIALAGALFSLLCLAMNGAGDDPASFQMYLLCCAIVLGSALIALALTRSRKG